MIVILKRKTLVCGGSWSKKSSKLFSLSPQFLSSIFFLNWFLKQISTLHQTVSFMTGIQKRGTSHSACTHGIHNPAPNRRQSIPCQSRDKKGERGNEKKKKRRGKWYNSQLGLSLWARVLSLYHFWFSNFSTDFQMVFSSGIVPTTSSSQQRGLTSLRWPACWLPTGQLPNLYHSYLFPSSGPVPLYSRCPCETSKSLNPVEKFRNSSQYSCHTEPRSWSLWFLEGMDPAFQDAYSKTVYTCYCL